MFIIIAAGFTWFTVLMGLHGVNYLVFNTNTFLKARNWYTEYICPDNQLNGSFVKIEGVV